MALAAMIAAGTTKKQRQNKGNIDKISAVIILESFLSKYEVRGTKYEM
jgi:putative Holliday junction resolvase